MVCQRLHIAAFKGPTNSDITSLRCSRMGNYLMACLAATCSQGAVAGGGGPQLGVGCRGAPSRADPRLARDRAQPGMDRATEAASIIAGHMVEEDRQRLKSVSHNSALKEMPPEASMSEQIQCQEVWLSLIHI